MKPLKYGEETKRKNIRMPISLWSRLEIVREKTGAGVSEQIVSATKEYFEMKGKK